MSIKIVILFVIFFVSFVTGLDKFETEHMKAYHGIEINDEMTFFKLHDLDGDGYWDEGELKYMFGIESDTDPNSTHIQHIIARIYQEIDSNKDRFISLSEYISKKLLPATSTNTNDTQADKKAKQNNPSSKKTSNDKTSKSKGDKSKGDKPRNANNSPKNKKKGAAGENSDPMFVNKKGYEGIPLKFRA